MERVRERELKIEEILKKSRGECVGSVTPGNPISMADLLQNANNSLPQTPCQPDKPALENSAPVNVGTEIATSKKHAIQDTELLTPEEQKQYLASLLVKANTAALEALINAAKEGVTAEDLKDYAAAAATMTDTLLAAQWNQILIDKAKDKGQVEDIQQGPQVGGRLVAKLHGKAARVNKLDKGDGRATPAKLVNEVLGPQDD